MAKRFLSLVLAIFLVLALLPGTALAANKSGKCGQNATWSLDSAGTLTIKGSGKMFNYSYNWVSGNNYEGDTPWWDSRNGIKKVVIQKGITGIGSYAFYSCAGLTSVTIPSGVTEIGDNAFYQCGSLAGVTLPSGVAEIGWSAFLECSSLKSVTIPSSVTRIGVAAFAECSSLSSVTLPSGITYIGMSTFKNCGKLTSVIIPPGVTRIDRWAFQGCSSLSKITIPSSVTEIGPCAFDGCSSLTSIAIPAGVMYIGSDAFSGCSKLASVGIPASVKNIDGNAFYGCTALSNVYYSGTRSQWDDIKIDSGNVPLVSADIRYNSTLPSSTEKTYTLTFNANGGAVTPTKRTVVSGTTYGELPVPTRDGYTFTGWYTTKTGSTKVTENTKATASRTIYAHWSKIRKCPVTFDPNGGTVLTEEQNFITGTRYRHLPTPTRASYHFDGWYTAKTGGTKITESTQVKSGVTTLYAHWTKTAPKVQSRQTGNYQIVIPEDYKVLLYTSETTASVSKNALAQTGEYVVACTKMVKLSNGTVRYYGVFPKVSKTVSYWFTYTDEMFVD